MLDLEEEIAVIAGALRTAGSGAGSLLLIEASAGLGKTRLAGVAAELARELDAGVLRARGGELERTFRFGVVRQLFEPALASLGPADRSAVLAGAAGLASPAIASEPGTGHVGVDQGIAVLHGLYWLTANLASERPLVLIVDDAHWSSDRASLESLVSIPARAVIDQVHRWCWLSAADPGNRGRKSTCSRSSRPSPRRGWISTAAVECGSGRRADPRVP